MPAQDTLSLGYNIAEFNAQTKEILERLTSIKEAAKQVDGTIINLSNFSGGVKDFKTAADALQKTQVALTTQTQSYNKALLDQAKIQKANADAQKAQVAADNEVIKQISLEADAEKKLAAAKEATVKSSQQKSTSNDDGSIDAVTKAQEKLNLAQSDSGKKIAEFNVQTQAQIKANKENALQALGLVDAYAQLQTEYNAAAKSAKALQAEALIDPSKIQAANQAAAAANDLNSKLKAIDASVGNYQRNVGNYTGAVGILEKALNEVNTSIQNFNETGNTSGRTLEQLVTEQKLLEQILGQNASGFSSLSQELRNNERALQTLKEQGLEDTEAFKQLQLATANARREVNEFQKTQKLLSSESPALAGIATAAKGVGAAYAVAAGSAALFSSDDQKLQVELNKLVAIMTLLQGLGEVNNVLKEKDAILTALQISAAKIYNGILSTLGITKKTAIAADVTMTETNSALAASQEEVAATAAAEAAELRAVSIASIQAAGATQADAIAAYDASVANEALAVSLDAEAVSAEAATAATTNFVGIFAATGIGALILAVGAAIVYLISKLKEQGEAFDKSIETQKSFADVLQKTNELLIQQAGYVKSLSDADKAYAENQLKFAQASGTNQQKQFALRKQINAIDKEQAQDVVNALGASYSGQAKLLTQLETLDERKQKALQGIKGIDDLIAKDGGKSNSVYDKAKESFQKQLDLFNSQSSSIKGIYDANAVALKNSVDANAQSIELSLEQQKYSDDERRKLILTETEIEVDLIHNRNDRVLANDKTYYDDKIDALQSNFAAEKSLIAAQTNDVLNNPSSSSADISIALAKQSAEVYKAQQEYYKNVQQVNNDIVNNTTENIAFRFAAEKRFYAASIELIDNEAKHNIITTKEAFKEREDAYNNYLSVIKALQKEEANELNPVEYNNQQLKLLEDLHQKQLISDQQYYAKKAKLETDLFNNLPYDEQIQIQLAKQKEFNDNLIKGIEQAGEDRVNIIAKSQAEANTKLNDEYAKGIISAEEYEKGKRDLAIKYAKESLEALIHVKESELIIDQQGNATADTIDKLTAEIAKLKEQLSELGVSTKKNLGDDLTSTLEKVAEITQYATKAFTDLSEISLDNQITQLQKIGDQEAKNYEQEVSNINDSTLSAEDKANRLKVLDAEHAVEQEKIQREQRKYDNQKAKFDRDANILNIITGTLASAAKAGWITPLAIAIEAAGLAGLIKAFATKIPSYRHGLKQDKPDHIGLYGDVIEMVKKPGEDPFISTTPTIDLIPSGTRITPLSNDEINEMLHHSMIKQAGQSIKRAQEKNNSQDFDKALDRHADKVVRAIMQNKPILKQRDLKAISAEIVLKNAMNQWKYNK